MVIWASLSPEERGCSGKVTLVGASDTQLPEGSARTSSSGCFLGLECNPRAWLAVAWPGRPRPGSGRESWPGGRNGASGLGAGWALPGRRPGWGGIPMRRTQLPLGEVTSSAAQEAGGSVQPVERVLTSCQARGAEDCPELIFLFKLLVVIVTSPLPSSSTF